jgi:hypothetical protein
VEHPSARGNEVGPADEQESEQSLALVRTAPRTEPDGVGEEPAKSAAAAWATDGVATKRHRGGGTDDRCHERPVPPGDGGAGDQAKTVEKHQRRKLLGA